MYSLRNTYNEILKGPEGAHVRMMMGKMMFSDTSILDLVPHKYHDTQLEEIGQKVKTPWGMPYPVSEIVDAANFSYDIFTAGKWEVRSLWHEGEDVIFDGTEKEVCLFTPVMDADIKRPAVIICPGGAYSTLSMTSEGFVTAEEYMKHGYRPYVLRYRLLPRRFPSQQEDLCLALLSVISHAGSDGIDPEDITIIGYSAGGHLCISTVSHLYEFKELVLDTLKDENRKNVYQQIDPMPGQMVLSYAPHSLTNGTSALKGLCNEEENEYYDGLNEIPLNYPETFAWACSDDTLVFASSTSDIGTALTEAGIRNETHIYPAGGHGITLGIGTPAEGWFDTMMTFMKR